MKKTPFVFIFWGVFFFLISFLPAKSAQYSSSNFIIKDPVINTIGGFGTSSSFQLFSSSGDFSFTGTGSSGSFLGRFGFLYFPYVTSLTLSGTAGSSSVSLSWTSSTSGLGFSVSAYEVGKSTSSGGPYTYTNVGLATSSLQSGLSNGTPYYFVVRVMDFFGNSIAVSNEVTATPTIGAPVGGGGGSITRGVEFSGLAYPNAMVYLLKNGEQKVQVQANLNGAFGAIFEEKYDSRALYTLYATDEDGERSLLLNYPIVISNGELTKIKDVKFPPTIKLDKTEVKLGKEIAFFGFSLPNTKVVLDISGQVDKEEEIISSSDGRYRFILSTNGFIRSTYEANTHYLNDKRISKILVFLIGNRDILAEDTSVDIPGDCNTDKVIDLRDFSVLAFWYEKENPPTCVDTNKDGVVNLIDFSILAYYWSG